VFRVECAAQVDVAALQLRKRIVARSGTEGFQVQAYWLSTTLALGAFLKASPCLSVGPSVLVSVRLSVRQPVRPSIRSAARLPACPSACPFFHPSVQLSVCLSNCLNGLPALISAVGSACGRPLTSVPAPPSQVRSIGKRDCANLFKMGDDMIQFTQLHELLAASVSEMLPVNVSQLLSESAKRLARKTALHKAQALVGGDSPGAPSTALSFESLMNSPWKVRAPRGRGGRGCWLPGFGGRPEPYTPRYPCWSGAPSLLPFSMRFRVEGLLGDTCSCMPGWSAG
jgi:hypothetical protein